ncbi:MAG: RdgB/HAM1 family non-canonical purine NTP pyrophosphatase [Clostridia bacterium]|nr:RdgB/HAM1 family non-canonical purine NTP pyrophosphatase [Clostridia bacterium]
MFKTILAATTNQGKVKEIKEILSDFEIISLKDAGIDVDVEENGKTFSENAYIKASEIAKLTNLPVLSDDSGLEIKALDGRPGVYSARYAGDDAPYSVKVKKLTEELKDVVPDERFAQFACAVCLILPDGKKIEASGISCPGILLDSPRGENGFGYDAYFYSINHKKTFAEMSLEEKNEVSHRKAALVALLNKIKGELNI